MIRHWFWENGYWVGPEEEMQKGAVEVPPRPSQMHWWENNQWVFKEDMAKAYWESVVSKELKRTEKFLLADIEDSVKGIAIDYRKNLRKLCVNPCDGQKMIDCPKELNEEAYYQA